MSHLPPRDEEKPDGALDLASIGAMAIDGKPAATRREFEWKTGQAGTSVEAAPVAEANGYRVYDGVNESVGLEGAGLVFGPGRCDCGRPAAHGGRCFIRRASSPPAREIISLEEIEEVMATESTIAKGAAKLGLTVGQLTTRRHRDAEVDAAVERGRNRYYEFDESDEPPADPEENITKMITEEVKPPVRTEIKYARPESTIGLIYLYLMTLLHDSMEDHEKDAVWTLIRYLKRLEGTWEAAKREDGKSK